MNVMSEPKKVTAVLRVVVTGEFYDEEATEETLRYCVEQDLGDAGFDVDVSVQKEDNMGKITREISLTFDQWNKVKDALDYYESAAKEFMSYTDGVEFRKEFILPVYEQMPDEVF